MKRNINTKRKLFEMMNKIDSSYQIKSLNEIYGNHTPREKMMEMLKQKFHLRHVRPTEEFNGAKGGIWTSGEDGAEASDGYPLFDYWSENHDKYEFGVHNEMMDFLEKNGWYAEWNDPGTIMIWED